MEYWWAKIIYESDNIEIIELSKDKIKYDRMGTPMTFYVSEYPVELLEKVNHYAPQK